MMRASPSVCKGVEAEHLFISTILFCAPLTCNLRDYPQQLIGAVRSALFKVVLDHYFGVEYYRRRTMAVINQRKRCERPGSTPRTSRTMSGGAKPSRPRAPILACKVRRSSDLASSATTRKRRPFLSLRNRFFVNVPGISPRRERPSSTVLCAGYETRLTSIPIVLRNEIGACCGKLPSVVIKSLTFQTGFCRPIRQ